MESCDSSHMVNACDDSTRGLTALYNVPASCCDLRSMAAPDKINHFLAHPFEEPVDPCDHNTNKMDDPPTPPDNNAQPAAYSSMAQPSVQDSEWTQAPHIEWVHYTILFIHYRYPNLHYSILLRITRRVGVLKELLNH